MATPETRLMMIVVALAILSIAHQAVAVEKVCGKPADIALVLDSSASISPQAFNVKLMSFVKRLVERFQISPEKVRFSLLTFGEKLNRQHIFNFDQYNDEASLLKRLGTIRWVRGEYTRTDLAVTYALKNFFPIARSTAKKIEIIITDGNPNGPKYGDDVEVPRRLAVAIDATKEEDVTIFAIGVGHRITRKNLEAMATSPDYTFAVENYSEIKKIEKFLAAKLCELPNIEPIPEEKVCDKPADIALVLDSSLSVGHKFKDELMPFVKDLVKAFQISPQKVRFSLLTFGHEVNKEQVFNFDKFSDADSLLKGLDKVKFMEGESTRTDLAINYAREHLFTKARDSVEKIEIIITDGRARGDGFEQKVLDKEIAATKAGKVTIFAIGVGYEIHGDKLHALATGPEYTYEVESYAALKSIKALIGTEICATVGRR